MYVDVCMIPIVIFWKDMSLQDFIHARDLRRIVLRFGMLATVVQGPVSI